MFCWRVTKATQAHFHERLCFLASDKRTISSLWVCHMWSSNQNTPSLLLLLTLSGSEEPERCFVTETWGWTNISGLSFLKTSSSGVWSVLPPRGRDSLKSPSVASQVLPSPPHTRHRSSLASELRMLSQPTCFEADRQSQEPELALIVFRRFNMI